MDAADAMHTSSRKSYTGAVFFFFGFLLDLLGVAGEMGLMIGADRRD